MRSPLTRALRGLSADRTLTLVVVLTLAGGIGVNAALVSLTDTLLFRAPAHVRDPDRLYRVPQARNYVNYHHLKESVRSLAPAAVARTSFTVGGGQEGQQLAVECVTASYFDVLGVGAAIGRTFSAAEDVRGGLAAVVISDTLWRRQFGRSTAVLGQTVQLGTRGYTVVGVMPAGFWGFEPRQVDAWVPLLVADQACSFTGETLLASSAGSWLTTVARLKGGVTEAQAEAELAEHIRGTRSRDAQEREGADLEPISARGGALARDGRVAVWLTGGAAAVLVIACLNVMGLLLIRALRRSDQLAIRVQLGATQGALLRQLAVEHAALMAVAGATAVVVSSAATSLLATFFTFLPGAGAALHPRALASSAVLACGVSALTFLVPWLEARARTMGDSAAGARSRAGVGGGTRVRSAILAAQVAVAFTLVVGTGLFVLSLQRLRSGLGFDLAPVAVLTLDADRGGARQQAALRSTFEALEARVRAVPGVESTALSSGRLLGSRGSSRMVSIRGAAPVPGGAPGIFQTVTAVSPEYFRTTGTRVVRGRTFTDADAGGGRPVCIVDEDLARELWPGIDPVGRCVMRGSTCLEIVGVTERRRYASVSVASKEFFVPLAQTGTDVAPQMLAVRFPEGAREALAALRTAVQGPQLPFVRIQPLADLADAQTHSWRLGATFFGLFGGMALVLAGVGLYGSSSFAVSSREREFALRAAIGASPGDIRRLIVREAVLPVVAGWAAGLLGSVWVMQYIRSLLFEVEPTNFVALANASALVFLAGGVACVVPALKASKVDPAGALRAD